MNIIIDDEYHSLYGGIRERKIGNAFQALVSHRFSDSLIFAIIENVNLNSPSIYGLGDTLFFTHIEDENENQRIKEEYKKIIVDVESKFKHSIAEYAEWYESHSVLVLVETNSSKSFNTETSGWRTRIFSNREEKSEKKKYSSQSFGKTKAEFEQFIKDYFTYYISLLKTRLYFSEFPYFAVLAKPIIAKDKTETNKLGNLYLHFATTESKPKEFYQRLLNDYLLIWLREEGSVIINQVASEAVSRTKAQFTLTYSAHLPAIWDLKNDTIFSKSEINKLGEEFGKNTGKKLNDFFYAVFFLPENLSELATTENKIIDELIPLLLKNKGWLKSGVTTGAMNTFINSIKKDVEHKNFTDFSQEKISLFISLLSLRHIVNICFCCFDYKIDEIHSLLTKGEINRQDTKAKGFSNKLTGYFSKLFFYTHRGNNIINFKKQDAYDSASDKEREFMRKCVIKIAQLIKEENKVNYNNTAVSNLQLNSIEVKKYNTDNVSRLAVFDFKQNWCNENQIIPTLLKEKAGKYLVPPILDCGAGLGDIAYNAFPDKEAILIDVNPIEDKETPISPTHKSIVTSIFDYAPDKQIETLLISHTLQFIDSDIDLLNKQIKFLNPTNIILVLNENNDIMGDILKWTKENYENSNPEEKIKGFPSEYKCVESIAFTADVKCNTFAQLAKQISYLMMIDLSETGNQLEKFLQSKLGRKPEFTFNQVIEIYQKPKS